VLQEGKPIGTIAGKAELKVGQQVKIGSGKVIVYSGDVDPLFRVILTSHSNKTTGRYFARMVP